MKFRAAAIQFAEKLQAYRATNRGAVFDEVGSGEGSLLFFFSILEKKNREMILFKRLFFTRLFENKNLTKLKILKTNLRNDKCQKSEFNEEKAER